MIGNVYNRAVDIPYHASSAASVLLQINANINLFIQSLYVIYTAWLVSVDIMTIYTTIDGLSSVLKWVTMSDMPIYPQQKTAETLLYKLYL